MAGSKNVWSRAKLTPTEDLPRFAWLEGYFVATHYNWDTKTWRQNSHELLMRDYLLGQIGDPAGKKTLDVGCGVGIYSMVLAELGAETSAQDLSEAYVEEGRRDFAELDLHCTFKVGDAAQLEFEDNYFDYVISADFFEHITPATKTAVLSEMYRVLKPGGIAVIKTPNLEYLQAVINAKRLANILRFKSPKIYIAHTRNNPDNEHHGLTTYAEMRELILQFHFLEPEIIDLPWRRSRLYVPQRARFPFRKWLNEHLLMKFQKSYFVPVGPRLSDRARRQKAANSDSTQNTLRAQSHDTAELGGGRESADRHNVCAAVDRTAVVDQRIVENHP
jgi:ubiquinone/menaquinone biosynthesis C-methylase UbiE